MTYTNVRFRAGLPPEDFVSVLAVCGHTTAKEIRRMFATCILCERTSTVAVVGLEHSSWSRKSKTGKLEFLLYGLCAPCAAFPDLKERTGAVIFKRRVVCLLSHPPQRSRSRAARRTLQVTSCPTSRSPRGRLT